MERFSDYRAFVVSGYKDGRGIGLLKGVRFNQSEPLLKSSISWKEGVDYQT